MRFLNKLCGSWFKFCIQIRKCLVLNLSRSGACANLNSLYLLMGKKRCFSLEWLHFLVSQECVISLFLFAEASKIQLRRSMPSFGVKFRISTTLCAFQQLCPHVQPYWTGEYFYRYLTNTNSVCMHRDGIRKYVFEKMCFVSYCYKRHR